MVSGEDYCLCSLAAGMGDYRRCDCDSADDSVFEALVHEAGFGPGRADEGEGPPHQRHVGGAGGNETDQAAGMGALLPRAHCRHSL